MKKNISKGRNGGFTLIELLVVVLIIGILSSVALPQYTKTVRKARSAEVFTIAKAYWDAQDVYYLANNEYAASLDQLDIELTEPKNWTLNSSYLPNGPLKLFGKNSMAGFAYDISISNGDRRIHCIGPIGDCMNMLPCLGIGSGSYGAYCYLNGIGSGSGIGIGSDN